jgi:hypothetical protein
MLALRRGFCGSGRADKKCARGRNPRSGEASGKFPHQNHLPEHSPNMAKVKA